MKVRSRFYTAVLGAALLLGATITASAREPENCGECEVEIDDDLGENVCPPSGLWKHRFWAMTSYGQYYAPHAQWTCGDCGTHQECGTLFADARLELKEQSEPVGSQIKRRTALALIERYPSHVRLDEMANIVELVDCAGTVTAQFNLMSSNDATVSD